MASTKLLTEIFARKSLAGRAYLENPLTGRERFRLRHFHNWGEGILLFGVLALLFVVVLPNWLAWWLDIALMALMYYFVFHVWDKDPVLIKCNHCNKLIETNTPWICGFKQCRNENVDRYPFVYKCEHCGAEPKAYQCHHCGKLIFLTRDELEQNYARCTRTFKERSDLDIPSLQQDLQKAGLELSIAKVDQQMVGLTPKPDAGEEFERQRAQALKDIEYETQKSKLSALREQEAAAERRAKDANLPLEERLRKKHDREFAAVDACRNGRKTAEELYKDDPVRLEQERRWWKNQEDDLSV